MQGQRAYISRFEALIFAKKNKNFVSLPLDYRKIINMYFSHLVSINHSIFELLKYNAIRLYLIKSHRGRCLALGKPSRGQRT
jgi:ribosomal protein S13